MKLIVGLGNKGDEYDLSRHNVGFLAIDEIAADLFKDKKFSLDKKFEGLVVKNRDLILLKPQTYMNNSGRAVRKVMDFYKMGPEDLVVIHDDLDIKLGEYKIQKGIGPKIHNGLNSVEQSLSDKDFLRVRVGIDNRQPDIEYGSGADYVLAKFSKEEIGVISKVLEKVMKEIL